MRTDKFEGGCEDEEIKKDRWAEGWDREKVWGRKKRGKHLCMSFTLFIPAQRVAVGI